MARSTSSKSAGFDKATGRAVLEGDTSKVPNRSQRRATRTKQAIAPVFTRNREFIRRYSVLDDAELDVVTVWAIGTHCFSPMCTWPATYPYLYVTGPAGSGKTVLGQDSLGATCRMWKAAAGATGPTLFRMLGHEDEETGEIENLAPTLFLDEIDATYSGAKDEPHRLSLNVGYKMGATIPRSAGKTSIDFPVYGPKILGGIDNGHLPETVTQRSIRIELHRHSQDELEAAGVEPFYSFDTADEVAEIQQENWAWAKEHSIVLRDYRPTAPKGLTGRQWEITRSLVQLAHAMGIEDRIVSSLITVLGRKREKTNSKQALYQSIAKVFTTLDTDRVSSQQLMAGLNADGVVVPGQSKKGLAAVLESDGIAPEYVRFRPEHPHATETGKLTARGYYLRQFDRAFVENLPDDDDDE